MSAKEQYWKYSLIVIIIGMGILIFKHLIPFLGGLLGAVTIYILVRKQMIHLTENKKMKRGMAATLITAEAVLCFLVPLGLIIWLAITNLQHLNLEPQTLITPLKEIINAIRVRTGYDILGEDTMTYVISMIPRIGQLLMASVSSFTVNVFVLIFVLYFMLIGGIKMERYLNELLPFNDINTRHVVNEINLIVRSNAIGIPLLALIQGGVGIIGYWIFGVPNILFAGFLTCFATVIPVVGTALVWIPLSVYLIIAEGWLPGIGLAAYGIIVISQSDNLIRLVIQKRIADIHPLITIFGVVIGLPVFGFMGIIFGPLLLSLFLLFVDMFKKNTLMRV